jgi:hypothetical protein
VYLGAPYALMIFVDYLSKKYFLILEKFISQDVLTEPKDDA